jgi:hypothetical protein
VKISANPALSIGTPTLLFQLKDNWIACDVTSDGSRFLATIPKGSATRNSVVVVLNGLSGRTNWWPVMRHF